MKLEPEKSALEKRLAASEDENETLREHNEAFREEVEQLQAQLEQLRSSVAVYVASLFERAVREIDTGDFSHAPGLLQGVLAIQTDNLSAKIRLAAAYEGIGQPRRAIKVLREILAKDPDNEAARARLRSLTEALCSWGAKHHPHSEKPSLPASRDS